MEAGRLVVLCLVVTSSMGVLAIGAGGVGVRPPAMYVFGDSTLDVGNNNYLAGAGVSRANHPYYGIDFPLRIPTGRFSNGYNTADYVAKSMGFVSGPPAYLSLIPSSSGLVALSGGVNYASGDAGILDITNPNISIPLRKQVQYFNGTKARMVAATPGSGAAVNALLARSVFLVGVGSNDLFAFATAQNSSSAQAAFFTSLISNYSAAIQELYTMGARKFAIINVGLLGCVPTVRVLSPTGACADGPNQLAAGFDAALNASLDKTKLPGFVYSLGDYYGLTVDTFADLQASGYTDIAGACCGSGRLNAEADCRPNSTLCANRDHFVFWDRYHPSQRASFLAAQAFYNGPPQYTTPINFMHLAQQQTT
ncbi:hypothetical protein EJB05_40913, partial [Eragrostis curvula]